MSNNFTVCKKKEQPLNERLLNICLNLHSFIQKKIIKKYVFPDDIKTQLPKEKKDLGSKEENPETKWVYIKNKEVTEEEKIIDVFKDDIFLGYLQILTNWLIIIHEYLEENLENIKKLEQKKKEENLKTLNELNILLNNYFNKNEEGNKNDKRGVQNIVKDQKIINIINKIKDFDLDIMSDLGNNNKDIINNIIKLNNNSPNDNQGINKNNLNNDINNSTEKEKQTKNNNEKNENFIYNLFKKKEINSMQKTFIINNLNKDDTKLDDEEKDEVREEGEIKDKKLLNKKYKKEKEEEANEKEDINIINKTILSSGKKKDQKNFKIQIDKKRTTDIQNQKEIPLNEEIKSLSPLKLITTKNKEIIEFDHEDQEVEKNNKNNKIYIGNNNNKKKNSQGVNDSKMDLLLEKNNNKKQQLSTEEQFDLELKREYCELNPINNKTKIIRSLLSLITTVDIQNYNPRISGPYLVGSYSIISELPSINYSAPIDIMYTYKDMLLNNNVIDFTVNNIIETGLNLNIFEKSEPYDDENKLTIIKVKCTCKQNISIILSFNIIFVDIKSGFNEKIVNNILFDGDKIKLDKKEDQKKFLTIILYLRTWRRKNNLFFLIPEILDEIAKKYLEPNRSMGTTILNVFYDLYNSIIDFNTKKNEGIIPKNKTLYENIIKICFQNEYNKDKINKAILIMNKMMNERNFKELFNIEEDEND